MIDVCLPGTGGMIPLVNRWLACCWLEYSITGEAFLIDCGEGTQITLKKCGCKLSRLDTLMITHYHADHIAGLSGLLLTLGNNGKTTPLTIIGPAGLEEVVRGLTVIAPVLPYPLILNEIKENGEGKYEKNEIQISYLPLNHGIPCLVYRITIKRKPIFNPEKAKKLNIPLSLYKALHSGQPIKLENGDIIEPEMVLDGERAPIKICYCTDTSPVDRMIDFASGSDLLICEGMYGNDDMRDKTDEKGHMVYSDSARIAKEANVKKLWLTHFSPALVNPEEYIENARAIFPQSAAGFDGIKITL
jgi:ribonuclease Z